VRDDYKKYNHNDKWQRQRSWLVTYTMFRLLYEPPAHDSKLVRRSAHGFCLTCWLVRQ